MYIHIYGAYMDRSIIQPWHLRYTEIQSSMRKSKNPKSKNSKLQNSKNQKSKNSTLFTSTESCNNFLDSWLFGFLGFLVLQLCFQSVETNPKLDAEKGSVCVGINSVFKGCTCRRGVDHIYIYIETYTHVYIYIYMYNHVHLSEP